MRQDVRRPATKLSEGYPIGQGTAIAVNPNNPNDIYVVWRQIRSDRGQDALLFARSIDGGRSFTKAEFIPGFGEGQFRPFDQNTTSKSARKSDDDVSHGRVSGSWRLPTTATSTWRSHKCRSSFSTPNTLGGAQARIYMTRTNSRTGWQPAVPVITDVDAAGQQFMPALAYAAGKMQMVWYDVRFDEAFDRPS